MAPLRGEISTKKGPEGRLSAVPPVLCGDRIGLERNGGADPRPSAAIGTASCKIFAVGQAPAEA